MTVTAADGAVKQAVKRVLKSAKQADNDKIVLNGSSLALNDDVLELLSSKVDAKLVLKVEDGEVYLINPRLNPKAKGGNKVTGKLTLACRGKIKEDLEVLGTSFTFKEVSEGIIQLFPEGEEDVTAETDTDVAIPEEEISELLDEKVEELDEELTLDDLDLNAL